MMKKKTHIDLHNLSKEKQVTIFRMYLFHDLYTKQNEYTGGALCYLTPHFSSKALQTLAQVMAADRG